MVGLVIWDAIALIMTSQKCDDVSLELFPLPYGVKKNDILTGDSLASAIARQ